MSDAPISPETAPIPPEDNRPRESHPASRAFFGPQGLRAGWSFLVALAIFMFLVWALSAALHATRLVGPHEMQHTPGPLPVFLSEFAVFLAIAITTAVMAKIERRPITVYGLGGGKKLPRLILGAIVGLLAISLLVFVLLKSGLLVIDQQLLKGAEAIHYALIWIPGFLAIGFFEEYLFRGFFQYTLSRGFSGLARFLPGSPDPHATGFWLAAFLVSFGFGAVHGSNPGESPAGLICAGLASLLFCFSLWRTGSLWWAIGMHAAWDYGQSFLFGVADSGTFFSHRLLATHPVGAPLLSGGATGPEGSLYCIPVLILVAAVIHFTQPPTPAGYAAQMPPVPQEPVSTPS